jgi:hypothetical protein
MVLGNNTKIPCLHQVKSFPGENSIEMPTELTPVLSTEYHSMARANLNKCKEVLSSAQAHTHRARCDTILSHIYLLVR